MKNFFLRTSAIFFSFLLGSSFFLYAGNCDRIILNDDFSTPSNWTAVGSGSVSVSGGTCNFLNASGGGVINKISQDLGTTLSDNYWKAECKFTITGNNPSGSGTSAILMALTAGNLDFMNDGSAETNQDGIAAVIWSDSPYDEDINNWKFIIENKKGSTRTVSTSYISANSSISTYYIRLERTSNSMVQLSVFTDAGFTTQLSGSPISFACDPAVSVLNTVQHGFATPAYPPRLLASATIDNDMICDDQTISCSHIILTDDFSNASNWTMVGDGSVSVGSGACNFVNASGGGVINRISRGLGTTLSDDYWKAECEFTIAAANPSGHGTCAILMALTAGSLDFMNDGSAETNQDGIAAIIGSDGPYDENINNWKFIIENKKGNVRTISTVYIYANSSISTYYIRLERTSNSMVQLSVFTDAGFTTQLSGSPITFACDPAVTGLNTIQHGFATPAYPPRLLASATIDDDHICENSGEGISEQSDYTNEILIYPNPSNDFINIIMNNAFRSASGEYSVFNVLGNEVAEGRMNQNGQINISDFSEGTYFMKITCDKYTYWGRFQKMKR